MRKNKNRAINIAMFLLVTISILWFISKIILSFFCPVLNRNIYILLNIFLDLPDIFSTLFIPALVVLLPNIYEKIKEKEWYSEEVDVQLSGNDKKPLEKHEIEIIRNLIKDKDKNNFLNKNAENKYSDYVYQLQESDSDFNLIWNNFNHFSNEKKRDTQINYWKIIVYRRILEYFYLDNKDKNKYVFIDERKNKHIIFIMPNRT
jgi:hypothetical protein